MDLLTPVDAVSQQEQQGAAAHGRVEPSKPYQVVERRPRERGLRQAGGRSVLCPLLRSLVIRARHCNLGWYFLHHKFRYAKG